ncbi:MAG TPA: aminotransferase class I/II-fold pyridoxal phosphate-dependent enzyme [Polyangiaceae bacterium]|nr:aminotransferase class I/II-fold pyridoxal phosphate-dependent enzyme [Polyangiaceae bacterium]
MGTIYLSPPDVGRTERELLLEAFDSNWIAPLGPQVDAFEAEFARTVGAAHAAALSSGTAALHLALLLLGIGKGDSVVVPTLTFAATANVVRYVGAEPIFIDSEPGSWNLSPDLLIEALGSKARLPAAVIAVDLYGQCANYDRIVPLCQQHGVPIIEDAAEALGAARGGKAAGSFGVLSAFSFNGNKIITTSGGGMLVTEDASLADRARYLASQARDPAPHYEHSTVGYNYRLSNLLAAVGRAQLRSLETRVAKRRAIFDRYRSELADLPGWSFQPEDPGGRSTRWLTCALVDSTALGASRDDICTHLRAHDIEARPLWKPMHLQPVFAGCATIGGAVAAGLFERGLCLPSGSAMTYEEQTRVIDTIRSTPRRRGKT